MKNIYSLFVLTIIVVIIPKIVYAQNGEFNIFVINQSSTNALDPTPQPVEVQVHQKSQTYAWGWDGTKVVPVESYAVDFNFSSGGNIQYDSPKSPNGSQNGTLNWGQYVISVIVDGVLKFTKEIDFRDQNWATDDEIYPSHDTNLYFTITGDEIGTEVTAQYATTGGQSSLSTSEQKIWELWGQSVNTNSVSLIV
jgi:hypothetical protein